MRARGMRGSRARCDDARRDGASMAAATAGLTALKPAEICEKFTVKRGPREGSHRHRARCRRRRCDDASESSVSCARRGGERVATPPRESSVASAARSFRGRESDSRRTHRRDQKVTPHDEFCHSP
jgi:hypothetical protein